MINFLSNKFFLLWVAIFVLIASLAGLWQLSKAKDFQLWGEILSHVETQQRLVALTFDDGPWSEQYTDQVLVILDNYQVKATFFLNGRGIEENPSAAAKIVMQGHEIGNHGYSHQRLVLRDWNTIKYEVDYTQTLIRNLGYQGPIHFRPPYGKKLLLLPWHLSQRQMLTVTWDVEPEALPDVKLSTEAMIAKVNQQVAPGSIILLHVLGSKNELSRQALPAIIEGLQAQGYRLVTVSELLQAALADGRADLPEDPL